MSALGVILGAEVLTATGGGMRASAPPAASRHVQAVLALARRRVNVLGPSPAMDALPDRATGITPPHDAPQPNLDPR
ncbi:hypothetical protein ACFV5G_17480 [Streptomyces sp. NPDC059766]|uniref:hypothetical protein n=1 Tax=Streptomyces sp. NPDC059766 TaxID=3346940 RepID=UPI00366A1638